jgi:hypothetical protein
MLLMALLYYNPRHCAREGLLIAETIGLLFDDVAGIGYNISLVEVQPSPGGSPERPASFPGKLAEDTW